jgi:hypothetical protein
MKKRLLLPACLVGMTLLARTQSKVPPPPEPPTVTMVRIPPRTIRDEPLKDFLRSNPDIKTIRRTDNLVVVTRKDNSIEKYNLADDLKAKTLRNKYGELPAPPPSPPPPPPPTPPKKKSLS